MKPQHQVQVQIAPDKTRCRLIAATKVTKWYPVIAKTSYCQGYSYIMGVSIIDGNEVVVYIDFTECHFNSIVLN